MRIIRYVELTKTINKVQLLDERKDINLAVANNSTYKGTNM